MPDVFRMGELALVLDGADILPELRGQIVEIVSLLGLHLKDFPSNKVDRYIVDLDGQHYAVIPAVLKKLPPPGPTDLNTKTEWNKQVWKPEHAKT